MKGSRGCRGEVTDIGVAVAAAASRGAAGDAVVAALWAITMLNLLLSWLTLATNC